jgi:flagellar motor protein MotB
MSFTRLFILIPLAGALLLLYGCAAPGVFPTSGTASVPGLVMSSYSACNQEGEQVASYLETGQPTSMDPQYGSERQTVLETSSRSQQDLYIRQVADQVISTCAQQTEQAQAQQQAAAQAARQAAQAAKQAAQQAQHEAQVQAREKATCSTVGGSWIDGNVCQVKYVSPADGATYDYEVDFDSNGNVVVDACTDDAVSNCISATLSVSQAEADCASGAFTGQGAGTWHADTDICSL